jgi:hypothetical protein
MEKNFSYPLGEDEFYIHHGDNYLNFFSRIGDPHLYAASNEHEIIALGAAVLLKRFQCWYLCDVKVLPSHRGKKIPLKLFRKYFIPCFFKSQRGFALTMENSDQKLNPIIKIMQRLPWTPLKEGVRLNFYYEEANLTEKAIKILSTERNGIFFSNQQDKKALILKSTNSPLPILHMEWGENAGKGATPLPGHLHMWCLPSGDPLSESLKELGIHPKAYGMIFERSMKNMDWRELRTSEL